MHKINKSLSICPPISQRKQNTPKRKGNMKTLSFIGLAALPLAHGFMPSSSASIFRVSNKGRVGAKGDLRMENFGLPFAEVSMQWNGIAKDSCILSFPLIIISRGSFRSVPSQSWVTPAFFFLFENGVWVREKCCSAFWQNFISFRLVPCVFSCVINPFSFGFRILGRTKR